MKKLLAIMVLGLLWSNSAYANHYGLTKNCYIKKISDPKLKSYERNSFSEMKKIITNTEQDMRSVTLN